MIGVGVREENAEGIGSCGGDAEAQHFSASSGTRGTRMAVTSPVLR